MTPHTDVTNQISAFTATLVPLDVQVPAEASSNSTEISISIQATSTQDSTEDMRGEYSPEAVTPTSILNLLEDDGDPCTPKVATAQMVMTKANKKAQNENVIIRKRRERTK